MSTRGSGLGTAGAGIALLLLAAAVFWLPGSEARAFHPVPQAAVFDLRVDKSPQRSYAEVVREWRDRNRFGWWLGWACVGGGALLLLVGIASRLIDKLGRRKVGRRERI